MKVLFLDDSIERHRAMRINSLGANVDFVFNAEEALNLLKKNSYEMIMLDHDLGGEDENKIVPDGYYVASYMARNMPQHKETPIIIHSLNGAGAERMKLVLDKAGYMYIHIIPFAWNKIMVRNDGEVVFRK